MLSLQACRKLLSPDNCVSDDELAVVREQIYSVVRLALTSVPKPLNAKEFADHLEELLGTLDEAERFSVEERAAIMEFDGIGRETKPTDQHLP